MKKTIYYSFIIGILFFNACTTSKPIIPLNSSLSIDDTYTIIWNGISEAYRFEKGKWKRDAQYDYQFDVIQKRYQNHWKSIKSLHRIHPDYDGKAGERDQTMYFEIIYPKLYENKVESLILSSLGTGKGTSDMEFRDTELIFYVEKPSTFLPYNKFKIRQHYNYEEGILTETVELLKEKDGQDIPFMKNEEKAYFFLKSKLNEAPTKYQP